MSFDASFRSYSWFLLIYFIFYAGVHQRNAILCIPVVCWHVCKNQEGLETIVLQKKKLSASTRNGFHTEIIFTTFARLYQRHAASLARTKPPCIPPPESRRTGAQWLRTLCSICPVVFATENREFCLSCTSLIYWCGLLHKRWLLHQQKQPYLGRRESARRVNQSSPGEIQLKHLGWNSWRLSAGAYHHSRPFEWGRFPGIPPEHASAAHEGDTPCDAQRNMIQHDGAPAHFSLQVRAHLNRVYREKWIGIGVPVAWPARSPEPTPLDFSLWAHVKSLVYINPS